MTNKITQIEVSQGSVKPGCNFDVKVNGRVVASLQTRFMADEYVKAIKLTLEACSVAYEGLSQ